MMTVLFLIFVFYRAVNGLNNFVNAEWVMENLGNVRVLDSSYYMEGGSEKGKEIFEKERIPTSAFVNLEVIVISTDEAWHQMPPKETFESHFSELGVKNTDDIVLYDQQGIFVATRVLLMLRSFGHQGKLFVLDGGLPVWKEKGFPVETEEDEKKKFPDTIPYHAEDEDERFIGLEEVKKHLRDDSALFIDARMEEMFEGIMEIPGLKSGHIPGAINIPFLDVLNNMQTVKTVEEIKQVFKEKKVPIDPQQEIKKKFVVYCISGCIACTVGLVMEDLGLEYQIYDGSWMEYAQSEGVQIVDEL